MKETHYPVHAEFSNACGLLLPIGKKTQPRYVSIPFFMYQHLYLRRRFFEHTINIDSTDLWRTVTGSHPRSMFCQLNGAKYSFTVCSDCACEYGFIVNKCVLNNKNKEVFFFARNRIT